MAQTVQILRTTTNNPPPALLPGALSVELGTQTKLWVGAAGGNRLLMSSDPNDIALSSGCVVAATPPANPIPGLLWWDATGGQLYVRYQDVNSTAWVAAASATGAFLPISGGTLTGPLILAAPPTVALEAATKGYADTKLPLAGGDLTGQLAVRPVSGNALMVVDKPVANQTCGFFGATAGKARWQIELGNGIAESGSNAGSNFVISRYNDAGVSIDTPLSINRATGAVAVTGELVVTHASSNAVLRLKKPSGTGNFISGETAAGLTRWQISPGDFSAESGSNAGSNFGISRFNDAGAFIDTPLSINRANGGTTLTGAVLTLYNGVLEVIGPGTSFTQYSTQVKLGYHGVNAYGIGFQPTANDGNAMVFNNAAKTMVGNIFNTATATSYGTSSDGERKEDFKSFDAGNIIDATNVYDFKWKDLDERAYGVIAQQAIEVYPLAVAHSVVAETDEHAAFEYWGVDYSKYVPVMLQELKTLRERVAALEGVPEVGGV